jgi:hypothetical protein
LFTVDLFVKSIQNLYEADRFHKLAAPINALSSPSAAFFMVIAGSLSKIVFVSGKNNSQAFAMLPPITKVRQLYFSA